MWWEVGGFWFVVCGLRVAGWWFVAVVVVWCALVVVCCCLFVVCWVLFVVYVGPACG